MSKKKKNAIDRRMFKKEGEELQQYLRFRKRGSVVESKKKYNHKDTSRVPFCFGLVSSTIEPSVSSIFAFGLTFSRYIVASCLWNSIGELFIITLV